MADGVAIGLTSELAGRSLRVLGSGRCSDTLNRGLSIRMCVLVQIKELNMQRDYFSSLFDETKYEELRTRGERRLSYKAMQAVCVNSLRAYRS